MNRIEKRKLQNSLKYKGTVILTYEIEYPEMISSNYRVGREIFNRYNRQKAIKLEKQIINELYNEAKEVYDYNLQNGYPVMVYEVVSRYNVTYNNNFLVSLYEDKYEFTGGAHGSTIRTSQNWDLRMGRKLPLSYFYPNNPYYVIDILKSINRQIEEQMQSGQNQYFEEYCKLVLETFSLENYYVTNKGIEIYFQQYDIAPYSSGIPTFIV